MIGTTLSHFQVEALLGEGGMGAVYRATDTKLGREVALKVLPEAVASDPERLARFEREARVLAALNHPHIASIYALESATVAGEEPGDARGAREIHFLVMELAEGEDLAARIARGPIPVAEAVAFAEQIADALAAAHDRGVVHRDLKPANVVVSPEGEVKVLDFGLAKALDPGTESEESSRQRLSMSPTLTAQMTQLGVILGTAAYMSPEQARGRPVDRRADVWSFGALVYEMLTGRQAFDGETVSDVLARILERPVDFERLPAGTPPPLRRLLERCLEKDPALRLRDIGDARWNLEAAREGESAEPSAGSPLRSHRPLVRSAFLFVAGCLVGAALLRLLPAPAADRPAAKAPEVGRFELEIPPSEPFLYFQNALLAFSPDGRILAYVGQLPDSPGEAALFLRPLDRFAAEEVPDTRGAYGPFFSPDGEWLGFFQGSHLWKKPLNGGAAVPLATIGGVSRGASWTSDGRIFYAPSWFSGISVISAEGGEPEVVTTLLPGEKSHRFPSVLPDASAVIFTVGRSDSLSFDDTTIEAHSFATGERTLLVDGGMAGRFLPPDRLLFARAGQIFLATLDLATLTVEGAPQPVLDEVVTSPNFGAAQLAVSSQGTLAYVVGGPELFDTEVVRISRTGDRTVVPTAPRPFTAARYSPDGRYLALRVDGANGQIWLYDLERETLSRLTREWDADYPAWSPDGERLVYALAKGGTSDLVELRADGTGEPRVLWSGTNINYPQWAPDGRSLVFSESSPTGRDIWRLDLSGEPGAHPFVQADADEAGATISPDGRWLAYSSDESGRLEVYVQEYPTPGRRFQVSAKGGLQPTWTPDGKELVFRNGKTLMVAEVELGARFDASIPHRWLDLEGLYIDQDQRTFDLSPDGSELVSALRSPDWQPATRLRLVLGWTSTLD